MGFRFVTVCSFFRTSSKSTMEAVCSRGTLMTTYGHIIHGVITRNNISQIAGKG